MIKTKHKQIEELEEILNLGMILIRKQHNFIERLRNDLWLFFAYGFAIGAVFMTIIFTLLK